MVYAKFYSGDAYGNLVVVENNGVLLYLAHLNSFAVKEGDIIRAGDTVGIMGAQVLHRPAHPYRISTR